MIGDHEKSIQYYERAMQLSPQDLMAFEAYAGISAPHFFLGRYDQALYWAERALRERPSERLALLVKIAALAMRGSRLEEPRNIVQQVPHFPIARIMQRVVLSRSRDRELLETALHKAGFPD
jgi:tetratricopeptide (TPR) repeat protein